MKSLTLTIGKWENGGGFSYTENYTEFPYENIEEMAEEDFVKDIKEYVIEQDFTSYLNDGSDFQFALVDDDGEIYAKVWLSEIYGD